METDLMKEEMLSDAQRLLDNAERLISRNAELENEIAELKATRLSVMAQMAASWIEFDEADPEKRPKDGEFVVVQVGNCQPYMLTYLKGCKVQINKWFRLPEW